MCIVGTSMGVVQVYPPCRGPQGVAGKPLASIEVAVCQSSRVACNSILLELGLHITAILSCHVKRNIQHGPEDICENPCMQGKLCDMQDMLLCVMRAVMTSGQNACCHKSELAQSHVVVPQCLRQATSRPVHDFDSGCRQQISVVTQALLCVLTSSIGNDESSSSSPCTIPALEK